MGSPNASDASGTDTSRKKNKNKQSPSQQPTSRPLSPNTPSSVPVGSVSRPFSAQLVTDLGQGGKKRVRNVPDGNAGSTSDVDGGAGPGGEMSESGKTKKLKLNPPPTSSSPGATPQGSRAGSPTPLSANRGFTGSRASSPEGGASIRGEPSPFKFPNYWGMLTLAKRSNSRAYSWT